MAPRLSRILIFVCLCGVAIPAAAQSPAVRLRARTFMPVANVQPADRSSTRAPVKPAPTSIRRHVLVQFAGPVTDKVLAQLRAAGALPLRYVPDNTMAVSIPANFDAGLIPGARWVGELQAIDRLSAESAADLDAPFPAHPLTIVEFHPDVTRAVVDDTLDEMGTGAVAVRGLPDHVAAIPTDARVVRRLAHHDAVAWIFPGAPELEVSLSPLCAGVARAEGIVANYAAMGEGWDGAGRGAARLSYFLLRPSPSLDAGVQQRELARAMAEWSRHAAIEWTPAASGSEPTSIDMLWAPSDHGDGFPFTPGVLAHAFYPSPPVPEPIGGDVHFNDTLEWGAGDPQRWDVFSVALHELGHSLGLVHSADPQSVMYPMYRGIVPGAAAADIEAIRSIYAPASPAALPSGWMEAIVGDAARGAVIQEDGRFTVSAAGRDIWGAADEFRFVSYPLPGDGDIVARVDSLAATHRWAKAGVMIRANATPGAAHAFALVSHLKGVAFQRRVSAGGQSLHTDGGPGTAPRWLWLSRRGNRVEAYTAADHGDWRLIGFETVALGEDARAGLALTGHDAGGIATAVFSHVSIAAHEQGWTAADIGDVGTPGGWTANGSGVSVRGAGADIWGAADAFHFVWQSIEGDVDIVARLARVDRARSWSKAGLMIRGGLERTAPHAFVLGSAARGFAFQRRRAAHANSVHTSAGSGAAPGWLKLSRRGDRLTAYRSADGKRWTVVGSDIIAMGRLAFVGLAVSSHTAAATSEAVFEQVAIVQK